MNQLLTIEEVSEILRTPVGTLRHWRQIGYGPKAARIGRRVLYLESDVRSWLSAQYETNGAA